jgi:hypothetical protein
MYERMKQKLESELQGHDSRICFTSDLWTSNQKLGYICLTAHYVDANFALHKKIISFKAVKYPHSGLAIEEAITRCMTEFTITLDNAANNKTVFVLWLFLVNTYVSLMIFQKCYHLMVCLSFLNKYRMLHLPHCLMV